jgi:hypothetical protein
MAFLDISAITIAHCDLHAWAVVLSVFGLFCYLFRLAALPRPIPGIPYNKQSARRILGDIPEVMKTNRLREWLPRVCDELQSPVAQFFVRPFTQPWVIISDFREAQDVLQRRTKEFDRSDINPQLFSLMPNHHVNMKSTDPQFKKNKELVRDLMTPAFLNEVSGILSPPSQT